MLMEQGIWTGRLRQPVYYSKRQEKQEKVKKIDEYNKQLIVENQREIPMTEIVEIVIVQEKYLKKKLVDTNTRDVYNKVRET